LQLAGGPFPFTQADSTDAGRNWSQTPHRLETCLDKWDRRARATATQWSLRDTTEAIYNRVRQTTIFDLPTVHRWSTDTLRARAKAASDGGVLREGVHGAAREDG